MTQSTTPRWKTKRTPQTRDVENLLRQEFSKADAYRYNSASIRVRVVDPRFAGKSAAQRDAMVERFLKRLPETTQGDIVNLLTLSPEEVNSSLTKRVANQEFEDPTPSKL